MHRKLGVKLSNATHPTSKIPLELAEIVKQVGVQNLLWCYVTVFRAVGLRIMLQFVMDALRGPWTPLRLYIQWSSSKLGFEFYLD